MTAFNAQQFSRNALSDLPYLVHHNARARWPNVSYLLNSDVAWRLPGSAPKENIRLWYDEVGIAAYAWFELNSPLTFDVRVDLGFDHPLCLDLIDWLEVRRRDFPGLEPWLLDLRSMSDWEAALTETRSARPSSYKYLQVSALEADEERIEFLERNGFERTEHFAYALTRSLDTPIPEPNLPEGMRVRHVKEKDFAERVETHRDAWFKSSFDLDRYLKIRAMKEFEPQLDIVAEDRDGTFASYCIGWLDRDLGVGSFEPVGTRPAYRHKGLGQQVNYEGLRRMKQMGMHSAVMGTAGFNDGAFGLYTSCGFALADKNRTYMKRLE